MNYKLVFHILGMILRVEAVLMAPSMAIGFATGDGDGPVFLLSAAITFAVGQLLCFLPVRCAKMQARDGFAAVALGWVVLSLFGALPYVFSGVLPNYVDAVFETVSGFTTTGATVFTAIEGTARGVLFWRAQTQWMGGVGVLILTLASIAAYDSLLIEWIIIVFMFLSGINFALLFYALRRNFKAVFESEELRSYTWMTVIASALIVANVVLRAGWMLNWDTVTDAVFQVVTLMTTTGYMTYDYVLWPTFSQVVLILVMFAGACAGSTAGGVKQIRVVLLMKNLRREVQRILHPRQVTTIQCDGERVDEPILSGITLFFFAYILLLLIGTLVVAWDDIGFTAAFTASLTCISNVGPAFGILGPTSNFAALSAVGKVFLSLNMLLGRLEIMPLLLLLFPSLWRKK